MYKVAYQLDLETLWRVTAPVVVGLFGVGYFLTRSLNRHVQIGARICFAVSGAWLGVVGFMWLVDTPTQFPFRILAGLGLGIAVFIVTPLLIREAWPPADNVSPANSPVGTDTQVDGPSSAIIHQGAGSAQSVGQSGGVTVGTINGVPTRKE